MKNSGIYENFAQHFCNEHKTTDHHIFFKRTHIKVKRLAVIQLLLLITRTFFIML